MNINDLFYFPSEGIKWFGSEHESRNLESTIYGIEDTANCRLGAVLACSYRTLKYLCAINPESVTVLYDGFDKEPTYQIYGRDVFVCDEMDDYIVYVRSKNDKFGHEYSCVVPIDITEHREDDITSISIDEFNNMFMKLMFD